MRWSNACGPHVLLISSLAKGFGAPLAVLAGSDRIVRRFERESETRVHTSPPSAAAIHAAEHALGLNRERGDELRLGLARLVRHLRARLYEIGLTATGGMFPVQTLDSLGGLDPVELHERLGCHGVRLVLHRGRDGPGGRISFLVTARHTPAEIDAAVDVLAHEIGKQTFLGAQNDQPLPTRFKAAPGVGSLDGVGSIR